MRGWRTPIFVSFSLHGALAATLLLVPAAREAPELDSEPVQIEIVEREPVEPPAPIVEEPTAKDEREQREKQERERRKKPVDRKPVDENPVQKPVDEKPDGRPPSDGGGGVVEGTGPVVGPGGGKTKDGRDLSSLDLGAKISVPRFEEQGNDGTTIVLEEPRDPKRRPTKDGGWRYDDSAFGAHVRADGTVTFDGRGNSAVDLLPDGAGQGPDGEATASWTIDVNDWILSAAGDDPYSYEKRRFLEATREERLAMARAACGERLSASLVDLPKRLSAIW